MKTESYPIKAKPLFIVLAVAIVGLVASTQQARSGLNIVGYANVALTNGYNFIANPLDVYQTNGVLNNSLTNLIPSPPDGTEVFVWDVTNQVFLAPATFDATVPAWDRNFDLPPGKGFVVLANALWTNTFVGTVEQGSLTNFVAGTNKFSLLADKIPATESLNSMAFPGTNGTLFAATDGQDVYVFKTPGQSYSDAFTYFNNFGWFDPNGVVDANGPVIAVAQSFFVQNPGPDAYWVRNFSFASSAAPPLSALAVSDSTGPTIRRLTTGVKKVTLEILNPSGGPYNVQFSTDGAAWKTVAKNRTGSAWTGPCPGGAQGYYQVVKP